MPVILVKLKALCSGLGLHPQKKSASTLCEKLVLKIKYMYVGNKLATELGLGYP